MDDVDHFFHIHDDDRVAVFIDGANLFSTSRSLGFDIDYQKLGDMIRDSGKLVRAFYYTALMEDGEFSSIRPLVDWLDYHGYHLVTKPAKELTDSTGRRRVKGNMDIELAVDMLEMANTPARLDHIVLFSGDGDFRYLIEAVQRKGVHVTVVSSMKTQPVMIADELRRQADTFVDLADMKPSIQRVGERRPRREYTYQEEEQAA